MADAEQTTISISLGALAPPLMEQLAAYIRSDEQRATVEHLDRDADAITRLHVRGLIPERASKTARDKIFKAACKVITDAR